MQPKAKSFRSTQSPLTFEMAQRGARNCDPFSSAKPDLHPPRALASATTQASYPIAPVDKEASLGCNSCLHIQKSQDKAFFCPLARTPFVLPDKRKYIASIRQREL